MPSPTSSASGRPAGGDRPLVSILTAVKNGARYLPALIESLKGQDYAPIEHIVIDDGSDDDGATAALLARNPQLRSWSRENRGQYSTQNEALAAARGSIVSIIAADDLYVPGAVRAAVEYLQQHPACDAVYGRTIQMDQDGRPTPYQVELSGSYPLWLLRYCLFIQHCSLFVRRETLMKHELSFDPSFRYAGDWDWILRLSQRATIGFIDRPMSMVRLHPAQTSRVALPKEMLEEYRRVCRTTGTSYAMFRLARHVLRVRAMALIAWNAGRSRLGRAVTPSPSP